jgi:hypothetical protein
MPSCGILRRVTLVRIEVSEELGASIFIVTKIDEVERVFLRSVHRLLVTANGVPRSPILVTLMMEDLRTSETRFLQEPHGVTFQKTELVM